MTTRSRPFSSADAWVLGATLVAITACVLTVHRTTLGAFVLEDDVSWIMTGRTQGWSDLLQVENRTHFFRPVVELYFIALVGGLDVAYAGLHRANVLLHVLNALLVFTLARGLSGDRALPVLASLLFALQAGTVQSVAWISGVSGVLVTTMALVTANLFLVAWRHGRRNAWAASLVAFGLALLTHEAGAAVIVLLAVLAALVPQRTPPPGASRWAEMTRRLAPHAVLLVAFLAVSAVVNSRNYVVTDGYYQLGWHAVPKLADYLASIYVGRHDVWSRSLTVLAFAAAAAVGPTTSRVGALWVLTTIVPYSFFIWPNTDRYLYFPAPGFALMLGAWLLPLSHGIGRVGRSPLLGRATLVVLASFICVRFAAFGARAAGDMAARSEAYRTFLSAIMAEHPVPPADGTLQITLTDPDEPGSIFVEPLLQWGYDAPGLRVVVRETRLPTRDAQVE